MCCTKEIQRGQSPPCSMQLAQLLRLLQQRRQQAQRIPEEVSGNTTSCHCYQLQGKNQ